MPDGWRQASEIGVGETAAMPASLPTPLEIKPLPESEVELMALLLAEGNLTGSGTRFSTGSPEMLVRLTHAAAEFQIGVKPVSGSKYSYQLAGGRLIPIPAGLCHCGCGQPTLMTRQTSIRGGKTIKRGQPQQFIRGHGTRYLNELQRMRREHSLHFVSSKTKRLPEAVYSLSDEQLGRFLATFWMCDGSVTKSRPEIMLASEGLVRDIQHILLRLGIQSSVSPRVIKLNGQEYPAWRLSVYSHCWERFRQAVPLWGHKLTALERILDRKRNHNVGDPSCTKEMKDRLYDLSPHTPGHRGSPRLADVAPRLGWVVFSFDMLIQKKGTDSLSRLALKPYLEVFGGEEDFGWLLNEEIFWDRIVSIEPAGEQQVYDLCVPETANFIANDVIVHNTTSATFLAAELAKRGRTLLVDADPQGSLLAWSVQAEGFDFPVVALPVDDLHKRIKQLAEDYEHVVIDTPPGHIKIVRSSLLAVDHVIIPLAPTLIEIDRLRPTLELMADVEGLNEFDVYFLFNRVRRRTSSAVAARQFLAEHMGLPLLVSEIPLWERYATAFGDKPAESLEYANVMREILGEELLVDPKHKLSEQEPALEPGADEVAGELKTPEGQELERLFREAGVKVTHRESDPPEPEELSQEAAQEGLTEPHGRDEPAELVAPLLPDEATVKEQEEPAPTPSADEQEEASIVAELPDDEGLVPTDGPAPGTETAAELDESTGEFSEMIEVEGELTDALTLEQAAEILERSLVYVEELISLDTLPTFGTEVRYVLRADLEGYMERRGLHEQFLARLELLDGARELPEGQPASELVSPDAAEIASDCLPHHFWLADWDLFEDGPDGVRRALHRCVNCGVEVMAADVDEATTRAELGEVVKPVGSARAAEEA
jgi:chromosome partitioning protein